MAVADRTETHGELEYARAQRRMYMYLRVAGEARAPATRIRLGRAGGVHGTYQKSSVPIWLFSQRGIGKANRTTGPFRRVSCLGCTCDKLRQEIHISGIRSFAWSYYTVPQIRRFVVASVKCSE